MAAARRTPAVLLAVVALALTVMGIVFAATDPNPAGTAKDTLALNGYPPTSANLQVTISGQSFQMTANVTVNFTTNDVEAVVDLPAVLSASSVEARLVDKNLYIRSADVSSGTWLRTSTPGLSLFGLSLEMTKPDLYLLTGFKRTVTHNGSTTTYDLVRTDVPATNPFGHTQPAHLGTINWSVTVGSQGEVVQSTLVVSTASSSTTVSVQVLSYNAPAHISAPPASEVKTMSPKVQQEFFSALGSLSFVLPSNITSLGQAQLS